jgi:aerotaxis receptor
MFFSTTDPKGVIRSGNAVFVRVSGHPLADLIGQPHNIIRHPDMPRAVFRLLWDYLHQGRPIAALVKNMARDGRYYWVIALITPVPGGFLSVRFKPSSPTSEKVKGLYTHMRQVEREQGDRGADGRAGMDAAAAVLGEALGALGFADYDAFMRQFLHEEMKSRDAQIAAAARRPAGQPATGPQGTDSALQSIHLGATQAYARINTLYQQLDELTSLNDRLAGKSGLIYDLTLNMRFVALSTTIKAAKLGEEGRGLEVIARYLGDAAARTSAEVNALTNRIKEISGELRAVIFSLASARLQLEMMLFFCRELIALEAAAAAPAATAGASRQEMIRGLEGAFKTTIVRALEFLGTCGQHLRDLNVVAEQLHRTILTLHVAQMSGRVEASRIHGDDSIVPVLTEIHAFIEGTARELGELEDITGRFAGLIAVVPDIGEAVTHSMERIEQDVQRLSAGVEPAAAPGAEVAVPVEPDREPLLVS